MSLENKFNYDESVISKIDNNILEINYKLANYWQDKTNLDKKHLGTIFYSSSALSFAYLSIENQSIIQAIVATTMAMSSIFYNIRPKAETSKKVVVNSIRLHGDPLKFMDISLYTLLGGINIGLGTYDLISSNEFLKEDIFQIIYGVGAFTWSTADYISRSDIKPPKKKKQVKDSNGILEKLFGKYSLNYT